MYPPVAPALRSALERERTRDLLRRYLERGRRERELLLERSLREEEVRKKLAVPDPAEAPAEPAAR